MSSPAASALPLDEDAACEVCVVGAGVSGLMTALELRQRGHDVLVLEAAARCGGQTLRSTAHLVTALDERYTSIELKRGVVLSRAAAESHGRAIARIENLVARHRLACGFERVRGILVAPSRPGEESARLLTAEREAASRAGVRVRIVPGIAFAHGFVGGALFFPSQAQVDPVRLLSGLARAFVGRRGRLRCGSPVESIRGAQGAFNLAVRDGIDVRARSVVLATHRTPDDLADRLRKVSPRVSYVASFEWHGDSPRSLLWDGYWDDPTTPYHYVRFATLPGPDGSARRVVIVGGEDEQGVAPTRPEEAYRSLERWTRAHLPRTGSPVSRWWGRIDEPEGEFALMGAVSGVAGLYVIAGDSGNGMTYAAIAAPRLADLIEGVATNPLEDRMYDPRRSGPE
jgi:glycine/D-amino acid oxidase-like deaminating enzyme